MSIDTDRLAAEQATAVASELLTVAQPRTSEADFRREAARLLENAALAAGLRVQRPRDEYTVARGRVDSLYNRLVLEYKRPGVLKPLNTAAPNRDAIKKVKEYISDIATKSKREEQRLAGVITDGLLFIFVRRVGEGWAEDEAIPVSAVSTEKFLRLLFSLARGAALIPENLVEDFGPQQLRSRNAVRSLYRAFVGSRHELVGKLFEQWRKFFSEATDYRQWAERIEEKPEFRKFVGSIWSRDEIKHLEPAKVFFVLHTYYALLIKLVASLAAARFAGGPSAPLSQLAAKKGDDLRGALADLERGGFFRELGIRNFLEGDFFGWYLAAWDHDVEEAVSSLIIRLADYDPGSLELAPENARDLLKKLYHYLLPKEIRHDLGEYYTPDWLAERLIRQTLGEADLGDATKRILDPACGSGTFLVLLIKHIRDRADRKSQDPAMTLQLILQNVVGFDLNPLAVIASRTNYLIALGDLLKSRPGEIDIPVYQADSILTPSQGVDLFEGSTYPLRTSVGIFRIPALFAERARMVALANILDESVEAAIGEGAFLSRVAEAAGLEDEEQKAVKEGLTDLYRQLRELHEEGVNGVWARIIKNAFAPVFIEPCHYVVGNPPWVNWQSLPDEYRSSTMPLWQHYGLFPHGGMDTILGKGKKDISMLMTYVAVDRYLRRGGKLGFVFSQSIFKTSGAGQGFRRFALPDKTPFGPMTVDDMVQLKPFEGAANRTAMAVVAKGRAVTYPVPYLRFRKKTTGRGSGIDFDTPYQQVIGEKITYRDWSAEPVDPSDPTSSWITARRGAIRAVRGIIEPSSYRAHSGAYTGGANGVYWVEVVGTRPGGLALVANITEGAKRKVLASQAAIEDELLYPLLRGRDVGRWLAEPSAFILMTQDPETRSGISTERMERDYPKAHSYLKRFEEPLRSRRDRGTRQILEKGGPFWSIFGVSDYTFVPWKVVWRYIASEMTCSVVGPAKSGKPVVPDHRLMVVPARSAQEAYFVAAALNSSPAALIVEAYTVSTQISTHVLEHVSVPKFSAKEATHARLAKLSESAHDAARRSDTARIHEIEEEIDQGMAKVWGLSASDVAEIKRSLAEA